LQFHEFASKGLRHRSLTGIDAPLASLRARTSGQGALYVSSIRLGIFVKLLDHPARMSQEDQSL
jgi:hypothetical protein